MSEPIKTTLRITIEEVEPSEEVEEQEAPQPADHVQPTLPEWGGFGITSPPLGFPQPRQTGHNE